MTFEEWTAYVFDHPVTDPAWHWDINAEHWNGPAATIVAYLTQTFERADSVLLPFSDAQVYQGLNYLVSASCSSYMFALREEAVPLASRLRGIQAMVTLFETCFAKRCSPHLSHLDEAGANPLNVVCYMWWDILPMHGFTYHEPARADSAALDQALLAAIKQILQMDAIVCQESALHGLGEWYPYYPEVAEDTIAEFLGRYRGWRSRKLRPELRSYAERARIGYVQ
jgi:hypothetical protein